MKIICLLIGMLMGAYLKAVYENRSGNGKKADQLNTLNAIRDLRREMAEGFIEMSEKLEKLDGDNILHASYTIDGVADLQSQARGILHETAALRGEIKGLCGMADWILKDLATKNERYEKLFERVEEENEALHACLARDTNYDPSYCQNTEDMPVMRILPEARTDFFH